MSDDGQSSFQARIRRLEAAKQLEANAVEGVRPQSKRRIKRKTKLSFKFVVMGLIFGIAIWAAVLIGWLAVTEEVMEFRFTAKPDETSKAPPQSGLIGGKKPPAGE